MKRVIYTTALAAAASVMMPLTAQAQNWYLGGSIGYNQTSDQTSEGDGRLVETEFSAGIATSSIAGYNFGNNFRAEATLDFRRNDGESLAFNGVERAFTAKGAESYSVLLSGYYDFNTGSSFTPYIGGGVGLSRIDNEFLYGAVNFEDRDTVFAWQASVGGSLPITEKIDGFVDVKYFSASSPEFTRTSPADNGVALDSEYDNFTVSVGYRWNFR